jgi:hypothetical protein
LIAEVVTMNEAAIPEMTEYLVAREMTFFLERMEVSLALTTLIAGLAQTELPTLMQVRATQRQ